MARLVFGMMRWLDGSIAGAEGGRGLPIPSDVPHRFFDCQMHEVSGSIYGRRMDEVMRHWENDQPGGGEVEADFATAGRKTPKWVASCTLQAAGPDVGRTSDDLGSVVAELKRSVEGEIEMAAPTLVTSLTALGLIDEDRLYVAPVVPGGRHAVVHAGSAAGPGLCRQRDAARRHGAVALSAGPWRRRGDDLSSSSA